jgi:hypothetical protein
MVFAGVVEATPCVYTVSWDREDCVLVCSCADDPAVPTTSERCEHIEYVDNERRANGGKILVLPKSADLSNEDMQKLVDDPEKLRSYLLPRLPIIQLPLQREPA